MYKDILGKIKNNETLVSHYRIFQLKEQRETTKLKK